MKREPAYISHKTGIDEAAAQSAYELYWGEPHRSNLQDKDFERLVKDPLRTDYRGGATTGGVDVEGFPSEEVSKGDK